jgi:hypothetical protein
MVTTFDSYNANAQVIFDSFPNELTWLQGGIRPNRQLKKPEAGYGIVFRYDEEITSAISRSKVSLESPDLVLSWLLLIIRIFNEVKG